MVEALDSYEPTGGQDVFKVIATVMKIDKENYIYQACTECNKKLLSKMCF